MMTNEKAAELATKVVEAAAATSNTNIRWEIESLCALYERMYDVIKKKSKE